MTPPGPGPIEFLRDVRRHGLLDYTRQAWPKYGDVFQVRLGWRTIVFALHPDAVAHISVGQRHNYDKRGSYDGVRKYILGNGLVTSTGDLWKRQRKLMAPFYTPKGIQGYADIMLRDGARLLDRWQALAAAGTQVDMAEEMTFVTASIILKAMFSTETVDQIHQMKDAVNTMIAFTDTAMTGLRLPLWIPTAKNRRYLAARTLVHHTIRTIIEQRRGADPATWPDDLLARLMNARDDAGAAMSADLLRDESITTFFAGHETTARTMTFTWYALAANPEVAARLHAEVDEVLGGRPPTTSDLRQLPYALQVIKEVLRLYPAAPFYVRDAVNADEITGFAIPAGAAVLLSPYYTHRHPQFWDNPESFDPDRWSRERSEGRHEHAYHPFAAGPRICIGNNFSLLESHLLVVMLAQRFTPRLQPGYRPRWEMHGTLGLAGGLPMNIVAR